jgi:hypothetical protein
LSLHNLISSPNDEIVCYNGSNDLGNCTERSISREEMESMSRRSEHFFIELVKDGPEFDSKRSIDGGKGEFVHDEREAGGRGD